MRVLHPPGRQARPVDGLGQIRQALAVLRRHAQQLGRDDLATQFVNHLSGSAKQRCRSLVAFGSQRDEMLEDRTTLQRDDIDPRHRLFPDARQG